MNTAVANIALGHLGDTEEIANIVTERSAKANAIRKFYTIAMEETLRDGKWTFARKFEALNLVSQNPQAGWLYAYRYPVDCLDIRGVHPGQAPESPNLFLGPGQTIYRNDHLYETNNVPYILTSDDAGLLIYCNERFVVLSFTSRSVSEQVMPADFVMAFSFKLAAYVAPSVTGGDPFNLGDKALSKYLALIDTAKASSYNEESNQQAHESELVTVRY